MRTLESLVLSYLANSLWQVPLIFVVGWLTARLLRSLGPGAEHRVWVGVLLLQTLLPAASMIPWETFRNLLDLSKDTVTNGQPHVLVVMGPGTAFGDLHFPIWLLAGIALTYAATISWFAARFMWQFRAIYHLGRGVSEITLSGEAADCWARCAEAFGVEQALIGSSESVFGPITIGFRRKLVVLPPDMLSVLSATEFRTVIAHEFAHMRRQDFLKNLLYELLSLPTRFHPVQSFTRDRLMETREMVCDQLAAGLADQHQYARSLLRLASLLVDGAPVRTPHTIGIFDATTFERRVMRLTQKSVQLSTFRRLITVSACTLLGIGICATTLAFSLHVDALAAGHQNEPSQAAKTVNVSPEVMQNQIIHKVTPVYPEEAKKARIQGKVVLDAVINKTGEMENLRVESGPKELRQSALDAVRQWTYKPYLLNGEPVEVRTTINVIYTLVPLKGSDPSKK